MEITNHKTYKELSKNKEIDTCSNTLFETSFREFASISPNQINWKLGDNTCSVILIDPGTINSSGI